MLKMRTLIISEGTNVVARHRTRERERERERDTQNACNRKVHLWIVLRL